ncbi:hypothetical protein AU255_07965 [Methyloprofundus sedimenti]|uniref:Uncharacterized protein n=1 Tax=Methyloprofundus sedimenti TaxID=1420851 RepID=A0A1V8M8F2_9GAMM|nr:hypothetical protein [Methyloprofundus sedimenti]OQK17786.1 hypothetical protein AU255_07965 [Methyloprofundus sedimenti]
MDLQNKSDNASFQFPGIAVAILALGLILIPDTPFKASRPSSASGGQKASSEDVRSRMWQDPFAAVALHRNQYQPKPPTNAVKENDSDFAYYNDGIAQRICNTVGGGNKQKQADAHSFDELRCQIQRDTAINAANDIPEIQVLTIMVPGGTYAEDSERRLRSRYAVISGLANSGYIPEDAEHIGYLDFSRECYKAFEDKKTDIKICDWPAYIPYEWFTVNSPDENEENNKNLASKQHTLASRVLVLWLDNDVLSRNKPLHMLNRLHNSITPGHSEKKFGKASPIRITFDVLGPAGSGTLAQMYSETINLDSNIDEEYPYLAHSTIFSSQATLDTDTTISNAKKASHSGKPDTQQEDNITRLKEKIVRTINTDNQLADTLVCELTLRGIIPFKINDKNNRKSITKHCAGAVFGLLDKQPRQHHIALIGEWDTSYSRNLKQSFMQTIANIGNTSIKDTQEWVHSFNYLRGIDGVHAGNLSPDVSSKNTKSKDSSKDDSGEQLRRPVGPNQFDYLRRLAGRISDLNIRLSKAQQGSVQAIGILGSDVYDKLLILQVLRKQFPGILFFTTDLDARLLHPAEKDWARNVVVASSFGLELHEDLQKGAPPFRDNYQTALYFTTTLAMKDIHDISSLGNTFSPRMFEIGQNGAVDLSPVEGKGIHPNRKDLKFESEFGWEIITSIVLLMCFLLYQCGSRTRKALLIIISLAVCLFAVYYFRFASFLSEDKFNGEPFSFTSGTSVWPACLIRFLAILASLTFIWMSIIKLRENCAEISKKFCIAPDEKGSSVYEEIEINPYDYRVTTTHDSRFISNTLNNEARDFVDLWGKGLCKNAAIKFEQLWSNYVTLNSFRCRTVRVVFMLALYAGCAILIFPSFDMPNMPFRGEVSFITNQRVLMAAVVSYLCLIFLIVDVTRLNDRFVSLLVKCDVKWSESVIKSCSQHHGIPGYMAKEKILLDLIVKRAEVVDGLIFYPFFILFLMIISRSHYFDNWQFTQLLMVIMGVTALIAIASAIRFRRAAQKIRGSILHKLQNYYCQTLAKESRANNGKAAGLSARIKLLIDEVNGIQAGPFVPLAQHPVIRAIAMPFGGVGGLYLIDYLTTM